MGDQAGDMRGGRGGGVARQDPFGELFGRGEVAGREQAAEVGVFGGGCRGAGERGWCGMRILAPAV